MIELELFGRRVSIENVVFDMNGTLSVDGHIPERVLDLLDQLSERVNVYILTSNTFGTASKLKLSKIRVKILDPNRSASVQKQEFVRELGSGETAAVGNGYNDHLMLKEAVFGVAVCWKEGAYSGVFECADVVVTSPEDAIGLFLNPLRVKATTRD